MAEPLLEPQEVKSPVTPEVGASSENKISGEASVATDKQVPQTQPLPSEADEWNRMKGSTQERIRGLLQLRDALVEENKSLKSYIPPAPTVPETPVVHQQPNITGRTKTPDQEAAVQALREFGILTKDDGVVTKKDLKDLQDDMILEQEYTRLESKFSGSDTRPFFDRAEIESHMKKTGIFNPEKAYEDLYKEELFDFRTNQTSKNEVKASGYSTKPSGSTASRTEPLTVDSLRERLAKPDGKEWWEKNRERILPQLGQLLAG